VQKAADAFDERGRVYKALYSNASNTEKKIVSTSVSRKSLHQLRRSVFLCQRDLLREQEISLKLSAETENPGSLGRWREINSQEIDRTAIARKVHHLQRRLIKKTEESVELSLDSQDRSKQISE